jgi:MFS family permease
VLAAAAGVPLLFVLLRPGVPVAVVLFGLSGMLTTAYLMQTQASFVRATPDVIRGRAIGVASSGIIAGQGVAVLAGGLVADVSVPSTAIAVCAAAGVLVAVSGGAALRRAGPRVVASVQPTPPDGDESVAASEQMPIAAPGLHGRAT